MKIIITGATGSLGAALTRYFSLKGHEVIASGRDNNPPNNLHTFASYFQADITKPFQFPDADVCIHTAALSDDKASLKELLPANVGGSENVINAAKNCNKFIHISSSSVYTPNDNLITEEMVESEESKLLAPYGKSKLLSEKKVWETTKHDSCFILRPRAFYGAGDRVILPRVLKLVNNGTFQRPGKMDVNVSLTHYSTVAHAIECCIASDKTGIHTYNVADDQDYIFIDIMRKIIKDLYDTPVKEKEIRIGVLKLLALFKIGGITPLLVRSFTKDMVLDISKIKTELNFHPEITFDQQREEMKNWVQKIGGPEILKKGEKHLAWELA